MKRGWLSRNLEDDSVGYMVEYLDCLLYTSDAADEQRGVDGLEEKDEERLAFKEFGR